MTLSMTHSQMTSYLFANAYGRSQNSNQSSSYSIQVALI